MNFPTRMFYLTGSSKNICFNALTLKLMVVFLFITLISIIYGPKDIASLIAKDDRHFYDVVKIHVIII